MVRANRWRLVAAFGWLAATLAVGLLWCSVATGRARAQFETDARILHRVLSQRMEQQEAVLASLVALRAAGVQDAALARYLAAIRAPYPQVVGAQRCEGGSCASLGPSGLPLPARVGEARGLGLRLVWPDAAQPLYALAREGVLVWVDARRLYRDGDYPDLASSFALRRPDGGAALLAQPERRPPAAADRLLPTFGLRKVLGSAAQPFVLEAAHGLRWGELPLAGLALVALLAGLVAAGLVRLAEGRAAARAAAEEAGRALAAERRLREREESLAHAARLSSLGEMGAGLAHELNQPLTAIVSHGQAALRLLEDPEAEPGRARRSVEATVAQAKRAAGIIAHLRALVRRSPATEAPVDLNVAVENVLALCANDLERRRVAVSRPLGTVPLVVRGDPVLLEQVLLNLVRNAAEAMDGAPVRRLEVRAEASGGRAQVTVRDTGPGLPTAARLFTPFATTKPGGLGLGLSLSSSLAQGMGGELRGEDHPEGGAVFTLALPLEAPRPASPAGREAARA